MTYFLQIPSTIDLTLARIRTVLKDLGNPQDKLPPVVHVAGTNGKGSTLAFLRSILEAEGNNVHVYTSPHLIRENERIKIGGQDITTVQLAAYRDRVHLAAKNIKLSYFEELTVVAFLAFAEHPADFCLIEVGLGGRLDATNLVTAHVCAITSISHDHQEYLGESIAEIAGEKAGIIKSGVPVVCASQKYPEAIRVLAEKASDLRSQLIIPSPVAPDIQLGLLGDYQYENAATALAISEFLLHKQADLLQHHLQKACWPGRLHKLFPNHDIWVDGAHNSDGIHVLTAEIQKWKYENVPLILAVSQLSNRPEELLYPLFHVADDIYHIEMNQGDRFRNKPSKVEKFLRVNEALSYFMQPEYNRARILFTGSLYMVGEILKTWEIIDDSFK